MQVSAGLALLSRGRLLLCHPTRASWFATYSIPKGLVEPGETLADAAIRETKEDVGITIHRDALHPGGEVRYDTKGKVTKVVHWFLADITILDPPDVLPKEWLDTHEVDWAGFLGREEAERRVLRRFAPLLSLITAP
jgi:ADP-ribose pyrophosphatase YjhB (NUDIX family)